MGTWRSWIKQWNLEKVSLKSSFLELEFAPKDKDKKAAWDLYIELLTRITTQNLSEKGGYEATALQSIHNLFSITRSILKENGPGCDEFSKIAVVVLNQIIRPFTAKWHKLSISGSFEDDNKCIEFRKNLKEVQSDLLIYSRMLADMADVEDLINIEI